ncbi:MAG: hypothetical protein KDA89_25505, partial [Planctomycetaceae bacterium]|nr:hypothetical protein [Planctomycetaceae bacterium]
MTPLSEGLTKDEELMSITGPNNQDVDLKAKLQEPEKDLRDKADSALQEVRGAIREEMEFHRGIQEAQKEKDKIFEAAKAIRQPYTEEQKAQIQQLDQKIDGLQQQLDAKTEARRAKAKDYVTARNEQLDATQERLKGKLEGIEAKLGDASGERKTKLEQEKDQVERQISYVGHEKDKLNDRQKNEEGLLAEDPEKALKELKQQNEKINNERLKGDKALKQGMASGFKYGAKKSAKNFADPNTWQTDTSNLKNEGEMIAAIVANMIALLFGLGQGAVAGAKKGKELWDNHQMKDTMEGMVKEQGKVQDKLGKDIDKLEDKQQKLEGELDKLQADRKDKIAGGASEDDKDIQKLDKKIDNKIAEIDEVKDQLTEKRQLLESSQQAMELTSKQQEKLDDFQQKMGEFDNRHDELSDQFNEAYQKEDDYAQKRGQDDFDETKFKELQDERMGLGEQLNNLDKERLQVKADFQADQLSDMQEYQGFMKERFGSDNPSIGNMDKMIEDQTKALSATNDDLANFDDDPAVKARIAPDPKDVLGAKPEEVQPDEDNRDELEATAPPVDDAALSSPPLSSSETMDISVMEDQQMGLGQDELEDELKTGPKLGGGSSSSPISRVTESMDTPTLSSSSPTSTLTQTMDSPSLGGGSSDLSTSNPLEDELKKGTSLGGGGPTSDMGSKSAPTSMMTQGMDSSSMTPDPSSLMKGGPKGDKGSKSAPTSSMTKGMV